jgi:hypothetical protein
MTIEIIRPADREAWLAARRQDVTASVAGCLLGVHPYQTAYGLWAEKTGRIVSDDADNKVLRRGRLLEPVAIEMLREDRPDWKITYHRDNAYYRDSAARMGATPDAFAERPDIFGTGIVQVKTVSEAIFRDQWLDPDTGEVVLPLWIAVQAIQEAELTGCTWACVVLMVIGRGLDLHIVDVPLHAGVKRRLRAAVREFWRMADAGEEPSIDWLRDGATVLDVYRESLPDRRDLSGAPGIDALIGCYVDAREVAAKAKRTADELRPQIIHVLGNAEIGETARWEVAARTSRREGHFVPPSTTRVLKIKRLENIDDRF